MEEEMLESVKHAGDFIHGGRLEFIAEEWLGEEFNPKEAES